MKSEKNSQIIYTDIESLIRKVDGCANNPENSKYVPCGYSMSTIWLFDNTENKYTLYHGKDFIKNFVNL